MRVEGQLINDLVSSVLHPRHRPTVVRDPFVATNSLRQAN